jgi:tRNA (cytidine/uridine-2'-O-)-methyltransferase
MPSVVLYQPKIPPNTGNIGRLCVGMHMPMHLIGPIEFDLSDKAVRRAGLDYWENLQLTVHDTPQIFLDWLGTREPWLITKFGTTVYNEVTYGAEDILLFGNELTGLPDAWQKRWAHRTLRIPMPGPIRSFNLANSAAIVMARAMEPVSDT